MMRIKVYIGILLMGLLGFSTLMSIPDILSIFRLNDSEEVLSLIVEHVIVNAIGIYVGFFLYKTGMIDFESTKKIPGQSYKDIVG